MKSINLFYYGDQDFVRELAKKGTESDITVYNRKTDEVIFTVIAPSKFPDKLSSLTDSIGPADAAIIRAGSMDRNLGEVIMALDLMGISQGIVSAEPTISDQISKILSSTSLSGYNVGNFTASQVIEIASGFSHRKQGAGNSVLVDHFFTVRSVGSVALGFVISGEVHRHQDLFTNYGGKKVQIRSIQMQDVDIDQAAEGSRVGLALKGIDTDELERGMILSDHPVNPERELSGTVRYHPAAKSPVENGSEIFMASSMRFQRGTISGNTIMMDSGICLLDGKGIVCSQRLVPRVRGIFTESRR
ncbi:MAG: EF-Tu/IF-2/RF-3 family GTPase [Candidatus Thermoplasmatota archaeon]|nr:EF-Tu/IF-2/RF-3 family GTPase [Candidatus Thermoplasmatota archaeon]MCL5731639.1 EF-Tu/IF-2/RF-3 family GTPase [Candidatus Thermoplasmatota archaeon]